MTLDEVLLELIQQLEGNDSSNLAWEQVREWPAGAVDMFREAGWIKSAVPAKSVECPGCEENCFMPVHTQPARNKQPPRHYVACDQRDDMGRIPIPDFMLQQWQLSEYQVARWIARSLGLKGKPKRDKDAGAIHLGTVQGNKKNGLLEWVNGDQISLQAGGHSLPLSEAIHCKGDQLQIDQEAIQKMVDRSPPADRYEPSTTRREARKLDTQEKYQTWQKEYRKLKSEKPGRSDNWCAIQISRQPMGEGYSPETIRKNMKP